MWFFCCSFILSLDGGFYQNWKGQILCRERRSYNSHSTLDELDDMNETENFRVEYVLTTHLQ